MTHSFHDTTNFTSEMLADRIDPTETEKQVNSISDFSLR